MSSAMVVVSLACRNVVSRSAALHAMRRRCNRRQTLRWLATQSTATTTAASQSAAAVPSSISSTNMSSSSPLPKYSSSALRSTLIALTSLSIGFAAGCYYTPEGEDSSSTNPNHVLPNGLPRTCCDDEKHDKMPQLTEAQKALPKKLRKIVGRENVFDGRKLDSTTLPFLKGARLGQGPALCILTPERLQDVPDAVQAIVDAGCVVIPQGQNTGLTGGSVPGTALDRPAVVLSMKKLDRIFPLDDGRRVVCLAGAGLASLHQFLEREFPHRKAHSTLGSTFLNPTAAAGVALGSGGTQLRHGPAYTERALYLRVVENKWKENVVETVNTLHIEGMEEKEFASADRARKMDGIPSRLDTWSRWIAGGYERDMRYTKDVTGHDTVPAASDAAYAQRVCQCHSNDDAHQISRYNADTRGPDPNRSEGKVVILATVHDTFPKPKSERTYWVSFADLDTALQFRRQVCLHNPADLPMSCEYLNKDSLEVIDGAGRVMGAAIAWLGTASPVVRRLWNVKLWVEGLPFQGADVWPDKMLYYLNRIMPTTLPAPVHALTERYDHHVMVSVGEFGHGELERFVGRLQQFAGTNSGKVEMYQCATPNQVERLAAFRFVAASAFRTWCVGHGTQGISVDYALPLQGGAEPPLGDNEASDTSAAAPLKRMRYSHFGCNVVHEDLAYAAGVDVVAAKHALKHAVEAHCHGKLPAEHGHGTEYTAPADTQARWKRMDPLNVLNPGVGGLSTRSYYNAEETE